MGKKSKSTKPKSKTRDFVAEFLASPDSALDATTEIPSHDSLYSSQLSPEPINNLISPFLHFSATPKPPPVPIDDSWMDDSPPSKPTASVPPPPAPPQQAVDFSTSYHATPTTFPELTHQSIYSLFLTNMEALYKQNSPCKFNNTERADKASELFSPASSRYLLVHPTAFPAVLAGYLHFRICNDLDDEDSSDCIYVFEIQVRLGERSKAERAMGWSAERSEVR